ncbi:hypothetical protein GF325_14650 [Candidatus Bathyarchaeota archaeon]|nr:hypothetical protein [Candidatus Bathyarchaeota archaeon]
MSRDSDTWKVSFPCSGRPWMIPDAGSPVPGRECILSPAVEAELESIADYCEFSVEKFKQSIVTPGGLFFLRVNTLKVDPGVIFQSMREAHPDVKFNREWSTHVPEAIAMTVEKGEMPTPQPKMVEADKHAAESVMLAAPLYAPGVRSPVNSFSKGDTVSIIHRCKTPWNGKSREFLMANGVAVHGSGRVHLVSRGTIINTLQSPFITPKFQTWQEFRKGLVLDQNFPSMLAARILAPEPGEIVLDACAGTGGKTTHEAQLMHDEGSIVAIDRSKRNLEKMRRRIKRLGIHVITPVHSKLHEARDILRDLSPNKVLIDPPCSALGFRPKIYSLFDKNDFKNFAANQFRLVQEITPCIPSGSILVYSTCTVTIRENEMLIARLVDELDYELIKPAVRCGTSGLQVPRLSRQEANYLTRFHPQDSPHVGFFIARMKKK